MQISEGSWAVNGSARGYGPGTGAAYVGGGTITAFDLFPTPTGSPESVDIDCSSGIDASDVQLVINGALGLDVNGLVADVDGNGNVDAVDVQKVINAALGLPLQ
ncbi:MAG: hypothetical protein HY706_21870 [Candidatus Hydrogenedentes bacterium]|nr:hypothetical protein [Candidatus Hydrogenedentota bacterium]